MAARVNQAALEVLLEGNSKVRLTQVSLEVLQAQPATTKARLTQAALEVFVAAPALTKARLAQAALELLLDYTVVGGPSPVTCTITIDPPDTPAIECSIEITDPSPQEICVLLGKE